ncbi:MAG: TonB-dependent receptor [Sphingomonadales bacterium]|nr:TonB-dependent receptor [Sphingomonadales bacterium]
MKNTIIAGLRTGAAPLVLGAALLAGPAFAQDAPAAPAAEEPVNEIIVTGSRITRMDLTAASPVSVVSAEQIQLANKPGVEEYLRNLPQAVAGVGSANNNGNPGVATVNLRNLGQVRTLVLVDGHRFVPYDSQGIVDLNMIPASLVKRVEVVTGGASAVYGSDAVAGVVNFIMKKDFTGIEADAQTGISEHGDGLHYDFSLTAGSKLGDKGNIVIAGTYSKANKVTDGDRDFSTFALDPVDLSAGGGSSTNAFGSIDTPGGRYTFTPTGFQPYSAARDSFNFNPYNLLQVPQEKWTATALANYELTDHIEFYARASIGDTKIRTEIAPSGTFGFSFNINYLTNPFLDPAVNPSAAGARAILAAYDNGTSGDAVAGDGIVRVGVRRRTTEVGPRITSYHSRAWQVVSGLKGDIGSSMKWEVFGQFGKSTRDIAYLNDLDAGKVQQALLVTGSNASNAVCTVATGGCSPANLFGIGNLSQSGASFISFSLSEKDTNDQMVVGGFVSGDLPLALVASHPAAFVLGVEYRKETGNANPDNNLRTGNSIGFGSSSPVDASYNVKEVYGEFKMPLAMDKPLIQSLGIEAGFRYSAYSSNTSVDNTGTGGTINNYHSTFNNWTFKIGGDWQPVDALRFRAMFQRAVRAPNLQEIGLPVTPGTGDASFDPCAVGTYKASDTTLTQLCRTVGGGMTAAQVGTIAQPTSGQVNNFSGGNPNLVPEVADTLTLGAVFRPHGIPGLTASIDYYDIKVKNAILATPEQAIIDACYYAERVATGTFCSLIHRNQVTGSLEGDIIYGVDATRRNIGRKTARGIDFAANYKVPLGDHINLLLGVNATYTFNSQVQFASVLKTYECAGKVGKTCIDPQPKFVLNQTTGLEVGPMFAQLTWRHLSGVQNDAMTVGYNLVAPSAYATPYIKSYDYFDLATRFSVGDRFQFRFAVSNLFNKQPPVVGTGYGSTTQNSGNTFPATYDALGRYFSVGANLKF